LNATAESAEGVFSDGAKNISRATRAKRLRKEFVIMFFSARTGQATGENVPEAA
jgi:hypothetical protein